MMWSFGCDIIGQSLQGVYLYGGKYIKNLVAIKVTDVW